MTGLMSQDEVHVILLLTMQVKHNHFHTAQSCYQFDILLPGKYM